MLDSIYHMTLKLLLYRVFAQNVKILQYIRTQLVFYMYRF